MLHKDTYKTVRWNTIGLLFACILFPGVGLAFAQSTNKTLAKNSSCFVPKDEIEVLAAIYQGRNADPLVIETDTQQWTFPEIVNLQMAARGRAIPSDLRKDFDEKNKSTCNIRPFIKDENVHFISAADSQRIFRVGSDEFLRRFGKNALIEYVSRVGFNSDRTLALVHILSANGSGAPDGILFLLQRVQNKWVIKFSRQIEA